TSKGIPHSCMIESLLKEYYEKGMVIIAVRVRPGASRSIVKEVMDDGTLKMDIAAAAEDGKANEELIRLLAREFGVSRSCVEIMSGETARRKLVRVLKDRTEKNTPSFF